MKKQLLILLLALIASLSASAYDFKVDRIYYNKNGSEATVTYKDRNYNSYTGSVTIPASVTYSGTTYSVTSIGSNAFHDCTRLTSVTIPNSVTSIGENAFMGCSGLTSVTIPNSVTSIGSYVFCWCTGLTSVAIPDSVTSIGYSAFSSCNSLTSVTIPDSVTSIGQSAFAGCSSLTSVTIPDSVTSIGDSAFPNCSGLQAFYGKYASSDNRCLIIDGTLNSFAPYGLSTYSTPSSVSSIGSSAFTGCSSLTSVTIPESVTSIGNWAFYGCSGLTSVTIPNSVISIGDYTFMDCCGLTSVTIPNSVTSIGDASFASCSGLTSVDISQSVTSIGRRAFDSCSGLTSVTVENDNPANISLENSVFYNVPTDTCVLEVPKGSKELYAAAAQWKDFFNIEEYDPAGIDEIYAETETETQAPYYDLTGRRVENPVRGIYIQNGKKVLVK